MFSAYPDGWPGLGLLLLRTAAGIVLVLQGIVFYRDQQSFGSQGLVTPVLMILIGVLLFIGWMTRFAAGVAAVGIIGSMFPWFSGPRIGLFETRLTSALALAIGAAIVSVGPGAFSVDARLFGRREVIIPPNRDDTRI